METTSLILQAFLALVFLYSGIMKSTQQKERLMSLGQTGVADLSYPVVRLIGISEILGAIGILLPQVLHILPVLTPITALCFAVIMIFALQIHYRRKEFKSVAFNIFLLLLSLVVAAYRFAS